MGCETSQREEREAPEERGAPHSWPTRDSDEGHKQPIDITTAMSTYLIVGGLYVASFARRQPADRCHIDNALVLFACNVILRTCLARGAGPHDRDAVARVRNIGNVILQRILAAVLVSEERIARAEEMAREYFEKL